MCAAACSRIELLQNARTPPGPALQQIQWRADSTFHRLVPYMMLSRGPATTVFELKPPSSRMMPETHTLNEVSRKRPTEMRSTFKHVLSEAESIPDGDKLCDQNHDWSRRLGRSATRTSIKLGYELKYRRFRPNKPNINFS
jgi:hypothetical protein